MIDPKFQYFVKQRTRYDKRNAKIIEAKKEHVATIESSAREMIAGASLIKKPERFKTLYYGLRLNHPRNVALIHPLMFIVRRIVYALSIIFLAKYTLYSVWLLMIGTILMLSFAVSEMPWKDPTINKQHIFNELVTYFFSMFLLVCTSALPYARREDIGYMLICFLCVFIIFNGAIMMRKVYRVILLLVIKWRTWRRYTNLRLEAMLIAAKIKITLDDITKPPPPPSP